MEKFDEIVNDKQKMQDFLKKDLGLDLFAFGFVKGDKISVMDSIQDDALGTYGLYEVMTERNNLNKKAMLSKTGAKLDD